MATSEWACWTDRRAESDRLDCSPMDQDGRAVRTTNTDFADYSDYTEDPGSWSHPSSLLVREGLAFEGNGLRTHGLPEGRSLSQSDPCSGTDVRPARQTLRVFGEIGVI